MRLILGLIILVSLPAHAGEKPFRVEVNPKIYDPGAFVSDETSAGARPENVQRPDSLPNKRAREAAFQRVPGLDESLSKMDELDRDLLFVRAKTKSLKDLRIYYPDVPVKRLARLQKETRKN